MFCADFALQNYKTGNIISMDTFGIETIVNPSGTTKHPMDANVEGHREAMQRGE